MSVNERHSSLLCAFRLVSFTLFVSSRRCLGSHSVPTVRLSSLNPAAPRVGHSPPFRSRYAFARSVPSLPAARRVYRGE